MNDFETREDTIVDDTGEGEDEIGGVGEDGVGKDAATDDDEESDEDEL